MKHFDELDAIETEIIRLGEMNNLFSVISNGAEQSSKEELISAVRYIEGSLNDIQDSLRNNYRSLFEEIGKQDE